LEDIAIPIRKGAGDVLSRLDNSNAIGAITSTVATFSTKEERRLDRTQIQRIAPPTVLDLPTSFSARRAGTPEKDVRRQLQGEGSAGSDQGGEDDLRDRQPV